MIAASTVKISNMAELPVKATETADAAPSWGAELERLLRALSDNEELLDEASHALQAATTGAAFDASPPVAALVRHCDTPSRRGEVASRVFYLEQDVQQRAAHVAATQYAEEIDDLIQRTDVIDVTRAVATTRRRRRPLRTSTTTASRSSCPPRQTTTRRSRGASKPTSDERNASGFAERRPTRSSRDGSPRTPAAS